MVCVWYDADGRPPPYQPPRVAEIDDGSMRFCGTWDVDRPIYMHLIEYMENTVDVQHFTPMHGKVRSTLTRWCLVPLSLEAFCVPSDVRSMDYSDYSRHPSHLRLESGAWV
jgi:hypothetical protein